MPAGPAFRRVGHEPNVNPALRRLTGVVLGLGRPDEKGRHYSFRLQAIGARAVAPAAGELRGWRLTILAGRRFASVFEVRDNSATEIEVEPAGETLDGLAERDVFVVEEIEPELPVLPAPTSRGPDADLPSA